MIRCWKWAAVVVVLILLGTISGFFVWLFETGTLNEFVRNIILLALGGLIGIPAGLQLDHALERRKSRTKRWQLLSALRNTLNDNLSLIELAVAEMLHDPARLPTSPLDLVTLDATADVRYELLDDVDLLKLIDSAHFGLRHLTQRIAVLHGRYHVTSPRVNRTQLEHLRSRMAFHRETHGLSLKLAEIIAQPTHGINSYSYMCATEKLGIIKLAVGLTGFDSGEETPRPHMEGGTYGLCKAAIAAIDKVLGDVVYQATSAENVA